jgi:hypothetical protein
MASTYRYLVSRGLAQLQDHTVKVFEAEPRGWGISRDADPSGFVSIFFQLPPALSPLHH